MSIPAGTWGRAAAACRSAALHPGVLVVVAVVNAPVTLVAVPQVRLCPATGNVVQPDGPRA